MAKGMAIILVVVGHTLQGQTADFDKQLWFRVIYSFHMPLFVFLSGAVAALWFQPMELSQLPTRSALKKLFDRCKKAFVRLLIPFICWGLIAAFFRDTDKSLASTILYLFRNPDSGLWFLQCIFYCIVLVNTFQALLQLCKPILISIGKKINCDLTNDLCQFILISTIWLLIHRRLGDGGGFYLVKIYFFYFLLGLGFFKFLAPLLKDWIYFYAIPIFIYLSPLWHRTNLHSLLNEDSFASFPMLKPYYAFVVAFSGISMIIFITYKLETLNIKGINYVLITLGKLSLGIYAMHYYLLGIYPPVISPLILSVLTSAIILKIPILRTALLGER